MLIAPSFFQTIRERINIVDIISKKIALRHRGKDYIALCPFHQEKTPSFTVNPLKQFYYCFGCNVYGDGIKFISEFSNISYKEAAILLAKEYSIDIPYLDKKQEEAQSEIETLYKINQLASNYFYQNITEHATQYLKSRNLEKNAIKNFEIGFAKGDGSLIKFLELNGISLIMMVKAGLIKRNENGIYEIFRQRIIFPIINVQNKIIAFGGRIINNGYPKYLNSPETIIFKKNETLYGEHKAIIASYKNKRIIVVEGYIDAIALHMSGFEETVATLGTAVNVNHLIKLWKSVNEIIICFDGDLAGMKAIKRIIELSLPLVSAIQTISFILLSNNQDPAEILKDFGYVFFEKLLEQRLSLSEIIWYLETKDCKIDTAENKAILEVNLSKYVKDINDTILKRNYFQFFRDKCWKLFHAKSKKQQPIAISNKKNTLSTLTQYDTKRSEELILTFILNHPEILNDDYIQEQLTNTIFFIAELEEFKQFILSEIVDFNNIDAFYLKSRLENTIFWELYNKLINEKWVQFYLSLLSNDITPNILFKYILKHYYLLLLKREWCIISSSIKNFSDLEKSNSYQQEIRKLEKELSSFTFLTKDILPL